jgi:hypothetical protein
MSAKRTAGSSSHGAAASGSAISNAILVGVALAWGLGLLVQRGRMTWPPYALLSSLATVAGCLALVGPLIFFRSGEIQGSLGELAWMTAGILIWAYDIAAVLQGQWRSLHWATPLSDRTLGLTVLAVLVAGWKCGLAQRNWSWTNVAGCVLSAFWVAMAICSWIMTSPGRPSLATL